MEIDTFDPNMYGELAQETTHEITKETEEEFEKQIVEDIKNIGDVSDITQEIPDQEKLDELKKLIDTMPREQIVQLMESLASNGKNAINPNKNSFSSVSKREMLQIKMRQKKDQYKYSRMTKQAKETEKKKYEQHNESTQNVTDNNCGHENCGHDHNLDHGHDLDHGHAH